MFASTAGGGAMGMVFREKPASKPASKQSKAKQPKAEGIKTVRMAGANRNSRGKSSRSAA
jgi:hypothetical protein